MEGGRMGSLMIFRWTITMASVLEGLLRMGGGMEWVAGREREGREWQWLGGRRGSLRGCRRGRKAPGSSQLPLGG